MKPEWISLVGSIGTLIVYLVYTRPFEPGKALYWLGCCILTVGLLLMKG